MLVVLITETSQTDLVDLYSVILCYFSMLFLGHQLGYFSICFVIIGCRLDSFLVVLFYFVDFGVVEYILVFKLLDLMIFKRNDRYDYATSVVKPPYRH